MRNPEVSTLTSQNPIHLFITFRIKPTTFFLHPPAPCAPATGLIVLRVCQSSSCVRFACAIPSACRIPPPHVIEHQCGLRGALPDHTISSTPAFSALFISTFSLRASLSYISLVCLPNWNVSLGGYLVTQETLI